MTTSPPEDTPPEDTAPEGGAPEDTAPEAEPTGADSTEEPASNEVVAALAARVAGLVGSDAWSADYGNAKVLVDRDGWVEAVRAVRDGAGLDFFSFLSAVDWSNDVAVGEPLEEPVEERYEVLVRLSSARTNDAVTLSTDVPKDDARLPTLIGVFGGADWHEREAAEMFGIDFEGHPNLTNLYLTDEFEGHPLRKSYPLLAREVKPWPGMVDVEGMPSEENTEAEAPPGDESPGDDGSESGTG